MILTPEKKILEDDFNFNNSPNGSLWISDMHRKWVKLIKIGVLFRGQWGYDPCLRKRVLQGWSR